MILVDVLLGDRMKILVTGSNGFIGKPLVKALANLDYAVTCFSHEDGDISHRGALSSHHGIDHVIHLAGRTFVPNSWESPYDYYEANVMGTTVVMEYCRKNQCSLTHISTYVYGEPNYLPVDEKHPIFAASPYHETKILGEQIVKSYSRFFDVKATILRPFNIYGPGQDTAFLIPKIINQVLNETIEKVNVFDLSPRRDYVYIDDVISAIIGTIDINGNHMLFNVGSGVSHSVEDVIKTVMDVTGISKPYSSTEVTRQNEISECVADISLLRKCTGFEPRYTLHQGVEKIIKIMMRENTLF